jgi:hypothetical protein
MKLEEGEHIHVFIPSTVIYSPFSLYPLLTTAGKLQHAFECVDSVDIMVNFQ